MSEVTYKKITDVERVETLNDAATVFVNDDGAMKQVDVKTVVNLPEKILKTTVSVDAESDGTVLSVPTYYFQIVDPSYAGLPLNNYNLFTAAELNSTMTANRFVTRFVRIVLTSGNSFIHFCTGVENVSADVKKYYFGDELAPIIVDGANNTFTLDTDWTKPTACVKTINGVEPDENGDVIVRTPKQCLFVDASAMVPGMIQSFWSVGTIIDTFRNESAAMRFGLEVVDAVTQQNGPTIAATASDIQAISDDSGNVGHKVTVWFGENHAPIVVNGLTNTITLDPDWVKPESSSGRLDVHFRWVETEENPETVITCDATFQQVLDAMRNGTIGYVSMSRKLYRSYRSHDIMDVGPCDLSYIGNPTESGNSEATQECFQLNHNISNSWACRLYFNADNTFTIVWFD